MSIRHPLAAAPRPGHQFATLAGGCFWCLEPAFAELVGVVDVECGYTGGQLDQPTYRQVCSGDSGHAEAVRIEFDPAPITYRELLAVFFSLHDPTTLDRQGNDVGTQYRSAIFWHDPGQRDDAQAVLAEAADAWARPVVTRLEPAGAYFRAEDEHQEYFRHHPEQGYCAFVIHPKIEKFRHAWAALRRKPA